MANNKRGAYASVTVPIYMSLIRSLVQRHKKPSSEVLNGDRVKWCPARSFIAPDVNSSAFHFGSSEPIRARNLLVPYMSQPRSLILNHVARVARMAWVFLPHPWLASPCLQEEGVGFPPALLLLRSTFLYAEDGCERFVSSQPPRFSHPWRESSKSHVLIWPSNWNAAKQIGLRKHRLILSFPFISCLQLSSWFAAINPSWVSNSLSYDVHAHSLLLAHD